MSELAEHPSREKLRTANAGFIDFLNKQLDQPLVFGILQSRKFQVRNPAELRVLADLAVIARHLTRTRRGFLVVSHSVQLMCEDEPIQKIEHRYGDAPNLQEGVFVVRTGNDSKCVRPSEPQFAGHFTRMLRESWLCPLDQNPRPLVLIDTVGE